MKFWITLLLISLTAGCNSPSDDGPFQVIHQIHPDAIKSWDPATAYDQDSLDVVPSVYETLYQYHPFTKEYKLVPLLAADMPTYSADHLTVTIRLKRGVLYQDDPCFKETHGKGREMKAQDFIYEFKRLALPSVESDGFWIFDGKLKGINAFHDRLVKAAKSDIARIFAEDVEGMKAPDDYTLELRFAHPYPQLLYALAMSFTSPVPHEAIEMYGDAKGNINDHPVGTGPFVLKTWDRERRVELVRNPTHHPEFYPMTGDPAFKAKGFLADAGKPLPFADKIVIDVIKEQQPQWLNFISGKKDMVRLWKDNFAEAMAGPKELSPKLAKRGIVFDIESGVTFWYIGFNMKDKVVGANKYLRQAMSSALDRDAWIRTFTNDTGIKAVTVLPPGTPGRPKNSRLKYDFDLERAKALMKKAGYPDGAGLGPINFDMRTSDSLARQKGDFFAQQFARIGIKLNVIYNTFPAYLEKRKNGNLQVSDGGWSVDYPDAENSYQLLFGKNVPPGPNESNYINPEYDRIYEKVIQMESSPERALEIQKLDEIVQEECPWALGYYESRYFLAQPWLKNFRYSLLILNLYKYWHVDTELRREWLKKL